MTPTTIQKIRDKTGYSLEAFIQVVRTDYQNLMSYNQISRKYGVNHKLIGEVLNMAGVKPRSQREAILIAYERRQGC